MIRPVYLALFVVLLWPSRPYAAELESETALAFNRYVAALEQSFNASSPGELDVLSTGTRQQLHRGEVVAWPGREDGIVDVPHGLIHHWRGAIFIPGVTLDAVLSVARDYEKYAGVYEWVTRSRVVRHEHDSAANRDRYWVLLRIHRRARAVSTVIDVPTRVEYRYFANFATAVSKADCINEIENAGKPDERSLPCDRGHGYLWRAATFSTYAEREGGVYIGLQTVGLSRRFPALLGWLIEPIARRLGRASASSTLTQLRNAVLQQTRGAPM